jgi:adenylate kinase
LVLLGPPGCGKGTQAEKLSAEYGLARISTGDMLREEVNAGSELGKKVEVIMEAGELVPDSVVLNLVGTRLKSASRGYVLDGFPRTVEQARLLDRLLENTKGGLDLVIALKIDDGSIVRRLRDRRSCPNCGAVYNLATAPPGVQAVCDSCGGDLVQREDDREETIRERLEVYRRRTEPLKSYYAEKSILRMVDGRGRVDQVYARIKTNIAGLT